MFSTILGAQNLTDWSATNTNSFFLNDAFPKGKLYNNSQMKYLSLVRMLRGATDLPSFWSTWILFIDGFVINPIPGLQIMTPSPELLY